MGDRPTLTFAVLAYKNSYRISQDTQNLHCCSDALQLLQCMPNIKKKLVYFSAFRTLNPLPYFLSQMPHAPFGWTCPQRWWRAALWCCTARWTVTLLPGSSGCSATRSLCGTRRPTSPSLWTMWRLSRRGSTPASGKTATASWTPRCTLLSSVSPWDGSCVTVPTYIL